MIRQSVIWVLQGSLVLFSSCTTSPFVQARDGRFFLDGRPHAFVGVNFWQGMNLAVDGPGGDREHLRQELDRLQALGVTNLRVMAASEGPNTEPYRMKPALMPAPGEYDERVFDGLDYLIAELSERDMHAVIVLNNFWEWSGGMAQYVAWHEQSAIPYPAKNDWRVFCDYAARFYTYPTCQQWFRAHIARVMTRVNRYTDRAYRDEPAIFAWELANEPRYYPDSWVDVTAAYIKSLDPNHMVTVGSEGSVGGDFMATHRSRHIDYTTIHIWPQNWGWFDPKEPQTFDTAVSESRDYVDRHLAEAKRLQKPLVIEEFGLARDWEPSHEGLDPNASTTRRDRFFALIFDYVLRSVSSGGPIAGSNVWVWSGAARPGDAWGGDPPHERPGWYAVYDDDRSTLELIANHAIELRKSLTTDGESVAH